jgi:adenylosuccinate synthase
MSTKQGVIGYSQGPASTAVIGLQWGDEGKGKAVDLLAAEHDGVVRYNGGANAGHSVVVRGERYSLHLVPSGILYPGKQAVIGNGVVVDPWKLVEELDGLAKRGVDTSGLACSSRAHAVLPYHKTEDGLREDLLKRAGSAGEEGGTSEIGTTRRGIGPAYADKAQRACAVRMGDLTRRDVLEEKLELAVAMKGPALAGLARTLGIEPTALSAPELVRACTNIGQRLAPMIKDTTQLLHEMLGRGKRLLFEGANGSLLDVDHGTYPFVTGSTCIAAGIGPGTGVPPWKVGRVLGVMKAYSTRVGAGPFPTELKDDVGEGIRRRGREYGTTTGRPRRVGWLDLVAVKYSTMINGATGICLTMLDVLAGMDEIKVCTGYRIGGEVTNRFSPDAFDLTRAEPVLTTLPGFKEDIAKARKMADLPANARKYVDFIVENIGVPADLVSVGPDREQTILV